MSDPARPRLSFWLVVALLALCAGGKAILYDTLDPDCFWHLKVAEQLQREGIHPLVDRLSFASIKEPWTPYSWLAELAMKRIWDAGGYRAAILTQALVVASIVILFGLIARRAASTDTSALVATAFATFLSLPYLSFRPATFTVLILLLCYSVLTSQTGRWRWLVVPLTALLTNMHLYAFLVPLWLLVLTLGAAIERQNVRTWGTLLAATLAASLATPMLPGVVRSIAHYQFTDAMVASPAIAEMQPFWTGALGKVSALLVVLFFATIALQRSKLRATDWLLLGLSTILLFLHGRYAPLFAIVTAPMLASIVPGLSDRTLSRPFLSPVVAGILVLGFVRIGIAFPNRTTPMSAWLNRHGPDAPGYPVEAAQFVETHLQKTHGRLINEFTWGGYLAYRLHDRYQVLMDGRTQLYSNDFWHKSCLGPQQNLEPFLAQQSADVAILQRTTSRFRDPLVKLGWRTVHQDQQAEVLVPPTGLTSLGQ